MSKQFGKIKKIIGRLLPDKLYLRIFFYRNKGYKLSLRNPQMFNEKIQWLKLYDRNPEYTKLTDKYEAKKWVKAAIGEEHIIPTIGVWEKVEDIDFEKLPGQFVLKCTHDSGSIIMCEDKEKFNVEMAKQNLAKALKENYFYFGREWSYKNIKPRIIAEKYMQDESNRELKDYKVFTFSGKPYCIQVDFGRYTDHKRNFYSTEWEYMPFTTCYPTDPEREIKKPQCLKELLLLSEKLAKAAGNPNFVRIDFYIIYSRIYFGEMTFYHGGGFEKFMPDEWDRILGNKLILTLNKRRNM